MENRYFNALIPEWVITDDKLVTNDREVFVSAINRLIELVLEKASAYADASGAFDWDKRGRAGLGRDIKIGEVSSVGLEVSSEYNDACNCHPEYQTASVQIPWTVIAKWISGEEWRADVERERDERRARLVEAERSRKDAEERAKQKRSEEAERKMLAALKEKYPSV